MTLGPGLSVCKSVQFVGSYLQAGGLGKQVQGGGCQEKTVRKLRRQQPLLPQETEMDLLPVPRAPAEGLDR